MNCDSELCGAGLRDGPAGGVDAIQLANAREARVGHGLVIGERGFLVVGEVADVFFFLAILRGFAPRRFAFDSFST